jgi:hypothetical protein
MILVQCGIHGPTGQCQWEKTWQREKKLQTAGECKQEGQTRECKWGEESDGIQ